MINIRELRVGNWVNLHKKVEYKAYQIDSGYDLYKLDESDCDDIDPIPLTEDILVKCGFVYEPYNKVFRHKVKERLYVDINNPIAKHFGNANGILVMMDYLHQLQNLYFAITREELNIIL